MEILKGYIAKIDDKNGISDIEFVCYNNDSYVDYVGKEFYIMLKEDFEELQNNKNDESGLY